MNSTPHITDCIFTENIATGVTDGGAIYNEGSSPVITNYIFSGNTADEGGAIYNCENSSPTVTNCTFSGNSADKGGGAIYIYDNCSPIITNCTFFGNSATYWGGAICNAYGFPTITNCILWGNRPRDVLAEEVLPVLLALSLIEGGLSKELVLSLSKNGKIEGRLNE